MFQWLHNLLFACTTNTSKKTVDINEFDQDPLGWSRDLLEHQLGEFSMAAVQANGVTEDRSQLDVGNKALFVGIYHGQNGAEASNFLSTNLFENLMDVPSVITAFYCMLTRKRSCVSRFFYDGLKPRHYVQAQELANEAKEKHKIMVSFNLYRSHYNKYDIKLDETFNTDPLAWSRPLVRHHYGEFSMAAVQANMDMEDQSQVEVGTDALFVGVYDGHKGDTAAIYLRNHVFRELLRRIQQTTNDRMRQFFRVTMETILWEGVAEMERGFIEFARNSFEQQHEIQNSFVSSGCLICIIWRRRLFVANVGNSRAVLGSRKNIGPFIKYDAEQMVWDHRFQNPDIHQVPTAHVQCIEAKDLIETSSCIGYAYLKKAQFTERRSFEIPLSEVVTPPFKFPLLSSWPDVYSRDLKDTDRFIIFGSGGFWKLISNKKAARVVNICPRDRIAERLVTIALEKGANKREKNYAELIGIPASNCISGNNGNRSMAFRSAYHDDITVIVVYLDKKPNGEGVRPEIRSYRGYDDTVRQSEFRNFYNNNANV
ncbi:Protein phosphatase 2C family protein [Trifolium repens]|nr:Protein phosphatase 2C family protein [Trifolium repens]